MANTDAIEFEREALKRLRESYLKLSESSAYMTSIHQRSATKHKLDELRSEIEACEQKIADLEGGSGGAIALVTFRQPE